MFQRLPKFKYLAPKTIEEACSMLAKYDGQAKIMAGGTGLLPQMKWRQIVPGYIIGLTNIPGLDAIEYSAKGLTLGALTKIRTVEQSSIIKEKFSILAQAASLLGAIEIRNVATVGGNLCNASPSANTALSLIALEAEVKIVSVTGERIIPLEKFFKGPGETVLGSSEILTGLRLPNIAMNSAGAYIKLGVRNTPVDRAIVSVATLIVLNPKSKKCESARIVLGAVAPIPMRAKKAEGSLNGKELNDRVIEEAANIASKEAEPISDVSASAEYRKEMVKVLIRRAIKQSLEQIH